MKRYEHFADHSTECSEGRWVLYDDALATIARLTAENRRLSTEAETAEDLLKTAYADLAEARAAAAAAYERAAMRMREYGASFGDPDYGATTPDEASDEIRALATEAETTALAEMLDAETRACAQIVRDNSMSSMAGEKAILARLDQRKGAGE